MKKQTKKTIKNLALIFGIALAILLVGRYMRNLTVGIGCEETAYGGAQWVGEKLIYSGIFGGGVKCGGESSSPMSGTTFTSSHNYARYSSSQPSFVWKAVQDSCEGITYPCITTTLAGETQPYNIYPLVELVAKYPDPNVFAENAECRVKGSTSYFTNYYGERFDFPAISYDVKGTEVKWLGNDRGFRCVANDGGTSQKIVDYAISQNYFGHLPNVLSGMTWLPHGATVEFSLKPECISDVTQNCEDSSVITAKSCIDGKLVDTDEKCSAPKPPIVNPPTWQRLLEKFLDFLDWVAGLFKNIKFFAVAGASQVEPNTVQTYQINLSTTIPDSDWSDGNYQVQYSNWVLLDKVGNIKQQGTWEEVKGVYTKSVTLTTPSNIGDYMLVAIITQYNMTYDFPTHTWSSSDEQIITKEAINIANKYVVIAPQTPQPKGFLALLQGIINFFKSLFGWK